MSGFEECCPPSLDGKHSGGGWGEGPVASSWVSSGFQFLAHTWHAWVLSTPGRTELGPAGESHACLGVLIGHQIGKAGEATQKGWRPSHRNPFCQRPEGQAARGGDGGPRCRWWDGPPYCPR